MAHSCDFTLKLDSLSFQLLYFLLVVVCGLVVVELGHFLDLVYFLQELIEAHALFGEIHVSRTIFKKL